MVKLAKTYHELRQMKTGKAIGRRITAINILFIVATQIMNFKIPILFHINILLIFAGIFLLEVRPKF